MALDTDTFNLLHHTVIKVVTERLMALKAALAETDSIGPMWSLT